LAVLREVLLGQGGEILVSARVYQLRPIPLSFEGEGEKKERGAGAPLRHPVLA